MTENTFWRRLANLFQKMPWLIVIAHFVVQGFRPRFTVGTVGVVFNEKGQVLLVEHVFHPRIPWGLPGGWVERSEEPSVAIRRELQEELTLAVEPVLLVLLEVTRKNHMDIAYLCRTDGQVGRLSRELLNYRWSDIDNLPRVTKFHYRAIQRALEMTEDM